MLTRALRASADLREQSGKVAACVAAAFDTFDEASVFSHDPDTGCIACPVLHGCSYARHDAQPQRACPLRAGPVMVFREP